MYRKVKGTRKRIPMEGKRCGKLTVMEYAGNNKHNKPMWLCRCDCGKYITTSGHSLRMGIATSCGCKSADFLRSLSTHNKSYEHLYSIYNSMCNRCYNPKTTRFHRYGGRGISVCEEWRNSIDAFCTWATQNGYKKDLTIDRINNDGNYEPSNCRWVDRKVQSRNTSSNRILTYKGESRCLTDWATHFGIGVSTLSARILVLKWDVDKALTTPVRVLSKRKASV